MPRPPTASGCVSSMPEGVFSPLAHRIAALEEPVFPLHVGDTWMAPCPQARMEALEEARHPGLHRYGPTAGVPELLDALVEKVRRRNRLACERDSLLVTAGATGGLACAVSAIADPGDEVLILAPFWPLIRGIVQAQRARPVEVPFYDRVASAAEAVAAVEACLGERSVALYVSTPSNPTGRVLPGDWLEALADLARRRDLWLLCDEVYEDAVYQGEHVSAGRFAPERSVSVFSFSKTYGMAGNRVGYLVGPPPLVREAHKVGVHTAYHAPVAGQRAALEALRHGDAWLEQARASNRAAGEEAARQLGLAQPEGSMFLFLDVAEHLDGRGLLGFLEDCLDDGLILAPGSACGAVYASWVRLCYASAPPAQVAEATRRLARRLGRPAA